MPRGQLWFDRVALSISTALVTFLGGCALSGKVTNVSRFESVLNNIETKSGDGLRLYYGGAIRTIPL